MPFADYRFEKTLNKIIEELFDDHPNNSKYYFGVNDYMNDEFNFPGEKYNWFFNFWPDEEYIPLMLGGYADFTQTDPRGYKNEKVSECLFKIDSNYDMTKITIGDAGIVNGMLSPEDLSEGHLDKALVYWDCC